MSAEIFTDDLSLKPYWLDTLKTPPTACHELPARAEIVIIGSGYTGLHAALAASRRGLEVVILEAGEPGFGCSTRNGGQISTSIKPSLAKLSKKFGEKRALALRQEGRNSLTWIENFIQSEAIDCDFKVCGRFHAAHTPANYENLARDAEALNQLEDANAFAVPRSEQFRELGTDAYFGGVVFPKHASLHPGKYHRALLNLAKDAGVQIINHCPAQHLEPTASGHCVHTPKGRIEARQLVVATNGYTTNLTPWLQRRVIPIGSYIIATEPLPTDLMDRLFPKNRIVSDSCKVVYYYRTSPDRRHVLFGGRVSANETDPARSGPKLYQDLIRIFPELAQYRISHSWAGTVGYSFDELAHCGVHNNIHYAMSYCGSGVAMAGYLGMRIGQKLAGDPQGQTAFDNLPFPTKPLYQGKPWFLPPMVAWYRWRDARAWDRALQGQK